MRKLAQYLVIHCTATPAGREVSAAEIRRWHLSPPPAGRGWHQVGYTDMIHLNGIIERLASNNDDQYVDDWEITNGVAGINTQARHIVYVGGLSKDGKKAEDTRTAAQVITLRSFVMDTIARCPLIQVAGHNQFTTKDCPSFNVPSWLQSIGIPDKNIYKPKK